MTSITMHRATLLILGLCLFHPSAAFIRKMRLERAAQLLEQEAGMVSQIAYRIGYQNADAFSRAFRQVFGVPPSEYPH